MRTIHRIAFVFSVHSSAVLVACGAEETDATRLASTESAVTSSSHAFIRKLADAAGEYFQYEATDYAKNVELLASSDVPPAIRRLGESLADSEESPFWHEASLTEVHAIVVGGERLGYVLRIDFRVDLDTWFDGGGTRYYVDATGEIVERVAFSF